MMGEEFKGVQYSFILLIKHIRNKTNEPPMIFFIRTNTACDFVGYPMIFNMEEEKLNNHDHASDEE
jgi:hypothetical protein